jgi:hypothetical protein
MSAHTLTFSAYNNLVLDGAISLSKGTLDLTAGKAITVNAPVSISGAGAVNISASAPMVATAAGNLPNLQLSFGNGASVDYGPTDNGGTLSIDGSPYTLIYALSALPGVLHDNTDIALATTIDASGTTYTGSFMRIDSGTFEGLGNEVKNLTIKSASAAIGLIGDNQGIIRDFGILGGLVSGGSISDPGNGGLIGNNNGLLVNDFATDNVVGGNAQASGGLAGTNNGAIINSWASGAVSDAGSNSSAGGLVGNNTGTIQTSYATGSAKAFNAGGLVGVSSGTISGSWASAAATANSHVGGLVGDVTAGLITNDHASGTVTGEFGAFVGGLVGLNSATVTDSYATGAVSGDSVGGLVGKNTGAVSGSFSTGVVTGDLAGGLIALTEGELSNSFETGGVFAASGSAGGVAGFNSGQITDSLAVGLVRGASTGGLVTTNDGTITNGYYSYTTTGQPAGLQADGSVGLSTTALQAALPAGFSSSVWGIIPGVSFPYLKVFYGGKTPQIISGAARSAATGAVLGSPIAGALVDAAVNGATLLGTTATGANGSYYFLLPPGSLARGASVLTWLASGSADANAVAQDGLGGSLTGMNLYQNVLTVQTSQPGLSFTEASLAAALGSATSGAGSEILYSVAGSNLDLAGGDSLEITATGSKFVLNRSLDLTGGALFKLVAAGQVSQTAGTITTSILQGSSVGGASFTDAGNQIAQLTGWSDASGGLALTDAESLKQTGTLDDAGHTASLTLSSGSLAIDGTIKAATLTLDAATGELTESSIGAIQVGTINATADTGILLTSSHNAIATIGANHTNSGPDQITQ